MTREIRFVGIDVGKFEICAFDATERQHLTVANSAKGHKDLVLWLGNPANTIIALEPTGGYEWALWETLCASAFDARQVSAAHVHAFARATGALAKTDPIDACLIARFIAFRPNAGRKPPVEKLRKLRTLNTRRRQLVEMRKRLSCQIKQRHSTELVTMDSDLTSLITAQITELEIRIAKIISHCNKLAKRAAILRSIPGIGPVLTATFIGDLPELGQCSEKQIAALVGLAPMNNDSGKKAGRRSIRGGRYAIRSLLYQAALVASRHNPALKRFAMRLKEKGKPHKLVLVAVARKLLTIANVLVAKNELWTTV